MEYEIPIPIKHVLIGVASRHGSTEGIADVLAETLEKEGIEVHIFKPDEITSVEGYDAAIIGSAVYGGDWLDEAKSLVRRHAIDLRHMPVYLFSSGPIGSPAFPKLHRSVHIEPLLHVCKAREHQVFMGAISGEHLSRFERLMAKLVHVPAGDYRDWGDIVAWARHLAEEIHALPSPVPLRY